MVKYCAIAFTPFLVSACCTGLTRNKIEDVHIMSGGAVRLMPWGYPVIGVGFNNVYVATCNVVLSEQDGQVLKSESWWSSFFCMEKSEHSALILRLATISEIARTKRQEGFFAGLRGDLVNELAADEDFLFGYHAAVNAAGSGLLKINYSQ